jgi:hypothetical protein
MDFLGSRLAVAICLNYDFFDGCDFLILGTHQKTDLIQVIF